MEGLFCEEFPDLKTEFQLDGQKRQLFVQDLQEFDESLAFYVLDFLFDAQFLVLLDDFG